MLASSRDSDRSPTPLPPEGVEAQGRARRTWPVCVCLLILHLITSYRYPWEDAGFADTWLRVNPDLALLLAIGFLAVHLVGDRASVSIPIAAAFLFVPLYRFGLTVMPVFYGKELDTVNDVDLFPGLVHLLLHRYPTWLQGAASILAVAVGALIAFLVHRVVRTALRAGGTRRWGLGVPAVSLLLVGAGSVDRAIAEDRASLVWAEAMLPHAYRDCVTFPDKVRLNRIFARLLVQAEERNEQVSGDLGRLGGVDVYVLFIESYGRAIFREPETARAYRGVVAGLEDDLREAGLEVYSHFCFPAVSGGSSSLAHAQFHSGVALKTRRAFHLLMESSIRCLPGFFAEAGYRTVNAQPAMPEEWAEGKFFGFQEDVFGSAFPYEGHRYPFGGIPDQFSLGHLLDTVIEESERPLLVQYVSTTSHAPFNEIPPYFEDWSALPGPLSPAWEPAVSRPITWLNYTSYAGVHEAYADAVCYSIETMVGFALMLTRPSLVLILGDHQPPRVGELENDRLSWDVPLHVIAGAPELLEPFVRLGFTPGFEPSPERESFSTAQFLDFFVREFSTNGAGRARSEGESPAPGPSTSPGASARGPDGVQVR